MLFSTGFYAILVDRQKDCIKLYTVNHKKDTKWIVTNQKMIETSKKM